MRVLEHVRRHGGIAAELARQRPFGAGAVEQEAAEHTRAGGGTGDLLHLGLAVDREQTDAEREGARDVALLLDRIAVGDAVGRGAGRERHLDLGDRGGVEAGAERGEQRQHLRRRVRLHGVEHARVGQRLGKGGIIVADDVEIDDEARALVTTIAQERRGCARSLALSSPRLNGRRTARLKFGRRTVRRQRERRLRAAVRWRHDGREGLFTRRCCLGLERENPVPHARQRRTSLFGVDLWRANETKKARSVVALSRVPR